MKIVCISDTHNKHNYISNIPEGDMIIHAGDCSGRGYRHEIVHFVKWFQSLPFKYKIMISGNHDFYFQENSPMTISEEMPGSFYVNPEMASENSIMYLENSMIEVEGIKIWGSPISPTFFNWAFMADRGPKIEEYWKMIPKGTDIIVTHGPPYKILDLCSSNVGCEELDKYVKKLKPKYHIFGHIHESYGIIKKGKTTYINASVLDGRYNMKNEAIVIDINPK